MFIVQDKQTGLYYRNTTGRGGWRKDRDWVADLQDVKPLRTMAAVRNIFANLGTVSYEFQRARWEKKSVPECCNAVRWGYGMGVSNKCEHYKAREREIKEAARAKYRVFRVSLQIAEECEL